MLRQLVLAIFDDEASADAAAQELTRSEGRESAQKTFDSNQIQAMGVIVLDEHGKLKTEKLGPRTIGVGVGIGVILAMLTPIGMAVGIIGGGVLGALHHRSMIIPKKDRERLGHDLTGGKAAVGVITDKTGAAVISEKLASLGGAPETHDLDDAAVKALNEAAASAPADAAGTPAV